MNRRVIIPVYLAICLILGGGSAAGYVSNLFLQLAALPIIGWSLIARRNDRLEPAARTLIAMVGALLVAMALQLIPLPPALWTHLPGRRAIADGYALLGQPLPWLPLSLAPEHSLASLLWFLPTIAVFLGMVLQGGFRPIWIALAVLTVAALSVPVGALQIVSGEGAPWYFYDITNYGTSVGFFANANHEATLLVIAIPFLAAVQARLLERAGSARRSSGLVVITSAVYPVIAVGLVINFSMAGLSLAVPVTVASFVLLGAKDRRRTQLGALGVAILTLVGVATILIGPFQNNLTGALTGDATGLDQLTRKVSIAKTLAAAGDYAPVGTGVGTFRQIYQTRENPAQVISTYMNHAHSDLAEVLLETGLVGAILMLLLLAWWARRVIALWRADTPDHIARAAAIASGAMMAHSLVDYPLRTAALAATFVACLALMAGARPFARAASRRSGARHISVD